MSREYTARMDNASITSSTNTMVALAPSSTSAGTFEILRAWASQSGSATSIQQQVRLQYSFNQAAANAPVGTGVTPQATKGFNDPASKLISTTVAGNFGGAVTNCTSEGTGAKTAIYSDAFNVLNGWLWVPTPPETHMIGTYVSSQAYGLFNPVTPSTLTNWNFGLSYRELG